MMKICFGSQFNMAFLTYMSLHVLVVLHAQSTGYICQSYLQAAKEIVVLKTKIKSFRLKHLSGLHPLLISDCTNDLLKWINKYVTIENKNFEQFENKAYSPEINILVAQIDMDLNNVHTLTPYPVYWITVLCHTSSSSNI